MRFHPVRGWGRSYWVKAFLHDFSPRVVMLFRIGVCHIPVNSVHNELLLLTVNPSELLLLIQLCDSYRWLLIVKNPKPWRDGESSFSLCKQYMQRLSLYWVSISLGMNPCLSFKANSRVSPDLHLSPVPCGKCSPWLQDFELIYCFLKVHP